MTNEERRGRLIAALAKPDAETEIDVGIDEFFNPWEDIIQGISGCYSSSMDSNFIAVLEAIRDRTNFDLIEKGYEYEMIFYILDGHRYTNCGTSPRGGWPDDWCADLWDAIIDKWKKYSKICWGSHE